MAKKSEEKVQYVSELIFFVIPAMFYAGIICRGREIPVSAIKIAEPE